MRLPAAGCLDRGFGGNWIEPHEHATAAVGRFVRLGWWGGPATLLGGGRFVFGPLERKSYLRVAFSFSRGGFES